MLKRFNMINFKPIAILIALNEKRKQNVVPRKLILLCVDVWLDHYSSRPRQGHVPSILWVSSQGSGISQTNSILPMLNAYFTISKELEGMAINIWRKMTPKLLVMHIVIEQTPSTTARVHQHTIFRMAQNASHGLFKSSRLLHYRQQRLNTYQTLMLHMKQHGSEEYSPISKMIRRD